jgi:DUF1680 family protein
VQTVADYAVSVYFHGADGIYVNLYTPSAVRWKVGGVPVGVTQNTAYPHGEEVELRVDVPKAVDFALHLRIPSWVSNAAKISVNGRSVDVAAERNTFASIRRRWKKNDTVTVRLPFGDRTEAIDDRHPETVARMRGPLMMVSTDATGGGMMPFYAVRNQTYTTYFNTKY